MGKEVLSILIGILGTIIGFYIGSTKEGTVALEPAEIRIEQTKLYAHVSVGSKPCPYSIYSTAAGCTEVTNRSSEDGWIVEQLDGKKLVERTTVTLEDTDFRNQRATRKNTIPKAP